MRWLYFPIYEFQLRQQEKKETQRYAQARFSIQKENTNPTRVCWHPEITAIVIASYEEREGQTRVSLVTPNSLSLENKIVLQLSHSSPPHELPKQPSFLGNFGKINRGVFGKKNEQAF